MPFTGDLTSLGNGTLLLALAAAFAHAFVAGEAPGLRRTFAALAPAALFCALCVVLDGPPRLSIALAAAAAGDALLARQDERFRVPAMVVFGVAALMLLWLLVGSLALALTAGTLTPRLGLAALGALGLVAGAALSFTPAAGKLPPAFAPALRHLGAIIVSVAALAS
ncbi:MAG: hypothetical protein KF849_14810 [Rhizobiaceae bacterium]|nr:hypothetical protein [Rhizobiaceae bacterium]